MFKYGNITKTELILTIPELKRIVRWSFPILLQRIVLALALLLPLNVFAGEKTVIRAGHFPNITHAQGVIAHGLSRQGKGWFEQRLGPDVEIQWFVYNAGPTAMEAILANSVDLTYVGPNPAINAHLRTKGKDIRIVAGACSGGAALVVQPDGRIKTVSDFRGKKVATPQFGNTQDVAARSWLRSQSFRVTMTGGDVLVVPASNPDQLVLFKKGEIDAAWTVEPWVSRLVLEGNGKVFMDEGNIWPEQKYVTTHLVTGTRFLEKHRAVLKRWIAAHVELTEWIRQNPEEAKKILNEEMKAETTKALPQATLDRAWPKLDITYDPVSSSLFKSAHDAHSVGMLRIKPELSKIYQLDLLNEVLREKNLKEIR